MATPVTEKQEVSATNEVADSQNDAGSTVTSPRDEGEEEVEGGFSSFVVRALRSVSVSGNLRLTFCSESSTMADRSITSFSPLALPPPWGLVSLSPWSTSSSVNSSP